MAVWFPPLPRCVGKGGKQCPGREAEQTAGEYLVTAECVAWRVSRLQTALPQLRTSDQPLYFRQNAAQIRLSLAGDIDDATPN